MSLENITSNTRVSFQYVNCENLPKKFLRRMEEIKSNENVFCFHKCCQKCPSFVTYLSAVRRHKARHSKDHVYKLPSHWRWRCNIISTVLCKELISPQVLASRTIGLKAEKLLMASSLLCLSMDCHVTVSALTWRVICEFHRTGQHSFSCQWMVSSCFVSSLCNSSPWWTLVVCNFPSFEVYRIIHEQYILFLAVRCFCDVFTGSKWSVKYSQGMDSDLESSLTELQQTQADIATYTLEVRTTFFMMVTDRNR